MSSKAKDHDGFIRDVYPDKLPEHALPKRIKFMAWHKPRKQFIRRHQWCAEADALISDIALRDGRPLKYLGLPGSDFLDIRALHHRVCSPRCLRLKFLGFNDRLPGGIIEQRISSHEVSHLDSIDGNSLILRDDIESLAMEDSLGFRRLTEYGPFDIVNLDLCNSVAMTEPQTSKSYYDAIHRIANYQTANRTEPWLMFLTTRADYGTVNREAMNLFMKCIATNMRENSGFQSEATALLSLDESSLKKVTNGYSDRSDRDQDRFLRVFGLGISKWLIKLVMSQPPKWSMTMLPSYSYRISDGRPNMISFAFRFDLILKDRTDQAGFSSIDENPSDEPSEKDLATALVQCTAYNFG